MNEQLQEKLKILPERPGCYLMKDRQGEVIYVGKAKVLKNRVRSYFTGSHDGKTARLVQEIVDFEYIVTDTEIESLVLELNLIKRYDPRYNIMLKDDKTYPYIQITNEKYPRLLVTRNVKRKSGKYFGPYPNAYAAQETKKLLDRIYPFRKCRHLPKQVCLYYHLGQCLAPCVYDVPETTYEEMIKEVSQFLKGGYGEVKKKLEQKMMDASEKLEFERAKEYRDQIAHIESVMEKQKMSTSDFTDRDIFGYAVTEQYMCVQVFFVRQGKLIERDVSIFPYYREPEEELITFIGQFYNDGKHLKPKEVLVPLEIDASLLAQLLAIKVHAPQRGQKKQMLDLAKDNAEVALREKLTLVERKYERTVGACVHLGELLGIDTPLRIEAFDNSHLHGTNPVSAMVSFVDGEPRRQEYRKYNLKESSAHDDYGAMREVVRRRYVRLLKEEKPLPDLIVIDGGKGQMSVAREVLEDELGLFIPILGLAKDDDHDTNEVLFGDPPQIIQMKKTSDTFYLLQRIQDEVHRFAITFQRAKRQQNAFHSILDEVKGIGEQRKRRLLMHFGSVDHIKNATVEELRKLKIPQAVAEQLLATLNQKENGQQ